MKKVLVVLFILILSNPALFSMDKMSGKLEDGIYFAQNDEFPKSGWKEVVTIVVKNGSINKVDWNAANIKGGPDKKTTSKEGNYPMVDRGGAQSDWHVQAKLVEDFYINNPDTLPEYKDDEGHSDTISGASIHIDSFYNLVDKALKMGPVGYGMYKDGYYSDEAKEFSENSGWKDTVSFTVISGYIVAANWDAIHKDGGDTKKVVSEAGKYGMKENGGAMAEWHEQAMAAEKYLTENQMAPKNVKEMSDGISGASIHVEPLFLFAEQIIPKR